MNRSQRRAVTATSAGPHLDRRRFLRGGALMGGAVLGGPAFLAACGSDADSGGNGGGDAKALYFANWPAYIDEETVDLFKAASGVNLKYTEEFNDNNEYFARIQPQLSQGDTIAPDLIAPTYWMAGRLIELGWVEEMPLDKIPNAKNLVADLRNPAWDPDGKYSMPWQSGMTGIAYNLKVTGRELGSLDDLFDPAFNGKIGMLKELRDTVGLMMLATGKDPAAATFDDAADAFDKIEGAKADGQIRQFTGNDYMDDLASGNFAACVGWSGDIAQLALDNPDLRFVVAEEGGMRWSDTMVIPKGSPNVDNVATWIDYVYDPVNAARIAAYIGYNTPVEGVREILAADPETAALAESELMFPTEETLSRLKVFATLSEDEETKFDERFSAIIGA